MPNPLAPGTPFLPLELDRSYWRVGETRYIFKTSNEGLSNSVIFQDDDELFLDFPPSGKFLVETLVLFTSNTAADFKYRFSIPSGSMKGGEWSYILGVANASGDRQQRINDFTVANSLGGMGAGGTEILLLKAVLIMGGTGGRVIFQWTQNTADAASTIVQSESYLKAERAI